MSRPRTVEGDRQDQARQPGGGDRTKRAFIGVAAMLVLTMLIVPMFMTMTASAPKPPPPSPPGPSPPPTGHEGFPYNGTPPSGHELAGTENTFTTTQQQMLYSKFVGFYVDHKPY